jgi:hypothetical protein
MRRAEMARRRKNLSEKRTEEEKVRPDIPLQYLQEFCCIRSLSKSFLVRFS